MRAAFAGFGFVFFFGFSPLTHPSFPQCVCLSKAAPDESLGVILVCALLMSAQHPEPTLVWVPVPNTPHPLLVTLKPGNPEHPLWNPFPSVKWAQRDFFPPLPLLDWGDLGFGHRQQQWCPNFSSVSPPVHPQICQSWTSCSSPSVRGAERDFFPPLPSLHRGDLGFGAGAAPVVPQL